MQRNDSYQAIPSWPSNPKAKKSLKASKSKRRVPLWLKVVGSIVVVFLVFGVVITILLRPDLKTAQKVSDAFVADMQADNAHAAYLFTSKGFETITSETQLAALIQTHRGLLLGPRKNVSHQLLKYTNHTEVAAFVYSVQSKTQTEYVKTDLEKDGATWHIVNFIMSKSLLSPAIQTQYTRS